jgi:hypothetical protein
MNFHLLAMSIRPWVLLLTSCSLVALANEQSATKHLANGKALARSAEGKKSNGDSSSSTGLHIEADAAFAAAISDLEKAVIEFEKSIKALESVSVKRAKPIARDVEAAMDAARGQLQEIKSMRGKASCKLSAVLRGKGSKEEDEEMRQACSKVRLYAPRPDEECEVCWPVPKSPRTAVLTVKPSHPDASVHVTTRLTEPYQLELPAGTYTIEGKASVEGREFVGRISDLRHEAGVSKDVPLPLEPLVASQVEGPPPDENKPPPDKNKRWTLLALGAATAAIAAGAVSHWHAGENARLLMADIHSRPTATALHDAAHRNAFAANALYVTGGAALALSGVLFFVEGGF